LALAGAACHRSAPPPSNATAAIICAPDDAACLNAQAKANVLALERQILAQHAADVNAAEANAAMANALGPAAPGANAADANAVAGATAALATLADGAYECGNGQHVMGVVDIRRGAFRYQPLGAFSGAFAPFQIDDAGHIQWGAAFEGINDTPPELITQSTVQPWGFDVVYQANPGSPPEIMRCRAPGNTLGKAPGGPLGKTAVK
ncbi:MAG TPA: hypothetical protein VN694_00160, partial [Caulobacteraceae bacterium]|nr:hypothetical protein [Caulobacteraceae bacterium]